MRTKILRRS